ncbi:MAG: 4-alpha-glucanotransferase [Acidobacteriota bacterium]
MEERSRLLRELAKLRGITDHYYDVAGVRHETSDEVRAELLKACGFATGTVEDVRRELEALEHVVSTEMIQAATVRTQQELRRGLLFRAPGKPIRVTGKVTDEGGVAKPFTADPASFVHVDEQDVGGTRYHDFRFQIPLQLDLGYYSLSISVETLVKTFDATTRLIVCPEHAYLPDWYLSDQSVAGIGISLYGLRSERDWGVGDLGDLCRFVDWAVDHVGVDFIGLNPIHAIFNRQPYNASPYLPTSRFNRNLIYLHLDAIEDFSQSPDVQELHNSAPVQEQIRRLRENSTVHYEEVAALKLKLLAAAFSAFLQSAPSSRRNEFDRFIEQEGELLDNYATFCAIEEHVHAKDPGIWSWTVWPQDLRDPRGAGVAEFKRDHAERILFFKYIQWQLDLQLAAAAARARERGMRIGLYLDLALAVDRHGADYWAYRHLFVGQAKSGAPPDPLGPLGQDWQFPPPDRERYRAEGYRMFSEKIRRNCRHAGALRLDHVMRLIRLFWIPQNRTAVDGAYVLDHADDLLKIVCLESVRNKTIIIGEDLGTVPDSIRETLSRHGILSYRVFYFERSKTPLQGGYGFKRPGDYPRLALATLSTHDLPTLAGFWEESDLVRRQQAKVLVGDEKIRLAKEERRAEKRRIAETLGIPFDAPVAEVRDAIAAFLASTSSAMMMLNQEDLFLEREQQNMPGTTAEHLNWARRMLYTIEELCTNPAALAAARTLRETLVKAGRCASGETR